MDRTDLNNNANNALDGHDDNGYRTLLSGGPHPIPEHNIVNAGFYHKTKRKLD
jgi:hypothetical protein